MFKVKNNLDSQIYAIKRIKLDQKNKQLTRKLRREVELLSRLESQKRVHCMMKASLNKILDTIQKTIAAV